jgi:hypothetical protein
MNSRYFSLCQTNSVNAKKFRRDLSFATITNIETALSELTIQTTLFRDLLRGNDPQEALRCFYSVKAVSRWLDHALNDAFLVRLLASCDKLLGKSIC